MLELYHGTSKANAEKIMVEGFIPDKHYNWEVKSKRGFVYLSSAYAPFYAMNHKGNNLALIKVSLDEKDAYPEDDYVMLSFGKSKYKQEDLDKVSLKRIKHLWRKSLEYMGNIAVEPDKVKILGVRYFNGKNLIMKCDPTISPLNFMIMGNYYKALSDWIYEGKPIMDFPSLLQKITLNSD